MGDEENSLTGVWVLRSAHHERVDTGEKILTYGDKPRGVLILHESGRMAAMITPSDHAAGAKAPRLFRPVSDREWQALRYRRRYRLAAELGRNKARPQR
jgi:Lipocalin-like domain